MTLKSLVCAVIIISAIGLLAQFKVKGAVHAGSRGEKQQITPTFHAKGTHQCQSKSSIGHKCNVEGYFNDCDEAYRKLKQEDCCGNTKEGGASIGFTLDYCVPN